ncbi:PhzF family phenazine biosynthesis protein [Gemmatimonadota bacterium]
MSIQLYQVDSFTDSPFNGNPAGVCLLQEKKDDRWMQQVAMEMNLAETAFLQKKNNVFSLRWFTPVTEVELCGHATLASAHILWETGVLPIEQTALFDTLSGRLQAKMTGDGWIEMDFPQEKANECPPLDGLLKALGLHGVLFCGKNRFDYLVEIGDCSRLYDMTPDFFSLKNLTERGVIVTCKDTSGKYDFLSRFFAPAIGIDEDPVTGSAHCCLAPFWAEKTCKRSLYAKQVSRRGGVVKMSLGENDRCLISGQAVTVMKIELQDTD